MKAFYIVVMAAMVVLFSYTSVVRAAHSNSPAKAAAAAVAASDNTAAAEPNRPQNYIGTVALLNGALYILRDEPQDTWYHLDDQQMPAKFLGKKVAVTGKLDAGVNMICVKDIEPANTQSGN